MGEASRDACQVRPENGALLDRVWGCRPFITGLDALIDAARAEGAALSSAEPGGWRPTHRHVKRGSDYQVIGSASLQAGEPVGEAGILVIYRDVKGRLWARPEVEFDDGRFEPLQAPNPPSPENVG